VHTLIWISIVIFIFLRGVVPRFETPDVRVTHYTLWLLHNRSCLLLVTVYRAHNMYSWDRQCMCVHVCTLVIVWAQIPDERRRKRVQHFLLLHPTKAPLDAERTQYFSCCICMNLQHHLRESRHVQRPRSLSPGLQFG